MLQNFINIVFLAQLLGFHHISLAQSYDSCPISLTECLSSPCLNGGQCVNGCKRFICNCSRSYGGMKCQNELPSYVYSTCENLYQNMLSGFEVSYGTSFPDNTGVYTINTLDGSISVFCDFLIQDSGAPWTIIQRRTGCEESFYRSWTDYERGFGLKYGDHWLGNYLINQILTYNVRSKLRIELIDWNNDYCFVEYDNFMISDATDKYRLISVGNATGTCGDSLNYHVGQRFSTYDQDNDAEPNQNCASQYRGAWWYNQCLHSNLNGLYVQGGNIMYNGICWLSGQGFGHSYKSSVMKITKY